MAWNEVYNIKFADIENNSWYIYIYKDGYAGTSKSLTAAGNPLKFEITSEEDDLFSSINETKATIGVINPSSFSLVDLYNENDMTYKVNILKNGTTYYTGYLTPDYSEEYTLTPNLIQLKANTGLSLLKNLDYLDASGNYYNGRMSEATILYNILSKIGYTAFNEFINLYDASLLGYLDVDERYTYIYDVSSWITTNSSLNIMDEAGTNFLRKSSTGAAAYYIEGISINGAEYRYVTLTYRTSGTPTTSRVYYKNVYHGYSSSYYKAIPITSDGQWHTLVLDMHSLDAGGLDWKFYSVTGFRLDIYNSGNFIIDLSQVGLLGPSVFTQIYLDNDLFKDMKCDKVLSYILSKYNATIQQKNGYFNIYRVIDLYKPTLYGRAISAPSTKALTQIDNPIQYLNRNNSVTSIYKDRPGSTLFIRPGGKITCEYSLGDKYSWLDNYDFDVNTYDGSTFKNWNLSNVALTAQPISNLIPGEDKGVALSANSQYCIYQSIGQYNVPNSTDQYVFQADVGYYNKTGSNISTGAPVVVINGNKYLFGNGAFGTWAGSGNAIYYSTTVNASTWTGWQTQKIVFTGIPNDTSLNVYLYTTGNPSNVYACFKNIRFYSSNYTIKKNKRQRTFFERIKFVYTPGGLQGTLLNKYYYDKSYDEQQVNYDYIYKPPFGSSYSKELTYNFIFGDTSAYTIANAVEQFAGVPTFLDASLKYRQTKSWNSTYEKGKTLIELIGNEIGNQYKMPRQVLSLDFIENDVSTYNTIGILSDTYNNNRKFYLKRGEYDAKYKEWNAEFYEVFDPSYYIYSSNSDVSFGPSRITDRDYIDVFTNSPYYFKYDPSVNWIMKTGVIKYPDKDRFYFDVSVNTGAARDASLVITLPQNNTSLILKVRQRVVNSISLSPNVLSFYANGTPLSYNYTTVTSTVPWTRALIDTGQGTSWITAAPANGNSGGTCTITASTNSTGYARSCIVRFTAEDKTADLTVTQLAT